MEHYEPSIESSYSGSAIEESPFERSAMLHLCGLLRKDDVQLVEYAAGLYANLGGTWRKRHCSCSGTAASTRFTRFMIAKLLNSSRC